MRAVRDAWLKKRRSVYPEYACEGRHRELRVQEPGSGGILKTCIWMHKNSMTRVTGILGSSYLRVIEGPCLGLAGKVTLEES